MSIAMRQMGRKSRGADWEFAKNRNQTHKCRFAMEGRRFAAGNSLKCGEKMGRFGGRVSGGVWVIFTLDAELNG
jgi:hypothetical protein